MTEKSKKLSSKTQTLNKECIFCGSTVPKIKNPSFERNAFTIFIMLEVLEVPETLCEQLLASESSPEEWFSCCQVCSRLGNQGMSILCKVEALKRSFKRIKLRLRDKVKTYMEKTNALMDEQNVLYQLRSCALHKSGLLIVLLILVASFSSLHQKRIHSSNFRKLSI